MQRIERYGVIALVFLLVTILAVAVWGQRKNQSLLSFLKRDKAAEVAQVDPAAPAPAPLGGLGLSDPAHVVVPAGGQGAPAAGALDPALSIQAPAGPGFNAVSFAPQAPTGAPTSGGSGFVSGGPGGASPAPTGPAPLVGTPPSGPGAAAAGPRTYMVKNGDTLGSIAKRELGSTKRWTEIEALNNVRPERLKVGMVLKLPAGAATASASPKSSPDVLVQADAPRTTAPAPKAPKAAGKHYNVRPGDSLSKIASAQLGDASRYAEILALNPGLDPARLSIGQTLRMPADARQASNESKSKARPSEPREPEVARADSTSKKARVQ